jgi:hypothetical protein
MRPSFPPAQAARLTYANIATDIVIDLNGYYATIYGPLNNTALGSEALANNTSGNFNTAAGSVGLQNNTTGSYNTPPPAGEYQR